MNYGLLAMNHIRRETRLHFPHPISSEPTINIQSLKLNAKPISAGYSVGYGVHIETLLQILSISCGLMNNESHQDMRTTGSTKRERKPSRESTLNMIFLSLNSMKAMFKTLTTSFLQSF
jgi:hypothetical protein